jgi:hypothetical protein
MLLDHMHGRANEAEFEDRAIGTVKPRRRFRRRSKALSGGLPTSTETISRFERPKCGVPANFERLFIERSPQVQSYYLPGGLTSKTHAVVDTNGLPIGRLRPIIDS